jgi:hypothetical protein
MRAWFNSVARQLGRAAVMALVVTNTFAQGLPVLHYDPPPGFYRSAITPPDDYASTEFDATLQVYAFRPFSGAIAQTFRKTLLRERIDPRYQESNVAAPPEFRGGNDPAGQLVLSARFAENVGGVARQRMRMVIVAGSAAAIVDASANNMATWQRALPAFNVLAASLRVDAAALAPASNEGPEPAGRSVAGLYMARTLKDAVDLNRSVGFNMTRVPALHYYLFSADGRVYRAYDDLPVPGGDPSRFDFDAARRADPVNSGRYTVQGRQLRIQMGGQPPQTIVTTLPEAGRLTIDKVGYVRQ